MIPRVFDRRILLSVIGGVIGLTPIYYFVAWSARGVASLSTTFALTLGTAAVVLFGYELFFAVQAMGHVRPARIIRVPLDDRIPFVVKWVWVYGFLYYAFLGLPIAYVEVPRDFVLFILGGLSILLLCVPVFLLLPTTCPPEWRQYPRTNISSRLLAFIQHFDNGRGCLPSLHCALAAYAATFIPSNLALVGLPGVVSLSCLFVKQHSLLDIPPSLAIGFLAGAFANALR